VCCCEQVPVCDASFKPDEYKSIGEGLGEGSDTKRLYFVENATGDRRLVKEVHV
jgi:hypothetical protein